MYFFAVKLSLHFCRGKRLTFCILLFPIQIIYAACAPRLFTHPEFHLDWYSNFPFELYSLFVSLSTIPRGLFLFSLSSCFVDILLTFQLWPGLMKFIISGVPQSFGKEPFINGVILSWLCLLTKEIRQPYPTNSLA